MNVTRSVRWAWQVKKKKRTLNLQRLWNIIAQSIIKLFKLWKRFWDLHHALSILWVALFFQTNFTIFHDSRFQKPLKHIVILLITCFQHPQTISIVWDEGNINFCIVETRDSIHCVDSESIEFLIVAIVLECPKCLERDWRFSSNTYTALQNNSYNQTPSGFLNNQLNLSLSLLEDWFWLILKKFPLLGLHLNCILTC